MKTNKEILEIAKTLDISKCDYREFFDEFKTAECADDFMVEACGCAWRFIAEDEIWDIYVSEIKELVKDCYTSNMPDWVEVDWEETAKNTIADGYGHLFSGYDGSEEEEAGYYIFRTN